MSELLFTSVEEAKILPGYKTDHSLILLKFDFGKFQKGKLYWKFNLTILYQKTKITWLELKKNNWINKTTLCEKNQNNYPTVAEIQPDKIQLLIEDDLFVFLCITNGN